MYGTLSTDSIPVLSISNWSPSFQEPSRLAVHTTVVLLFIVEHLDLPIFHAVPFSFFSPTRSFATHLLFSKHGTCYFARMVRDFAFLLFLSSWCNGHGRVLVFLWIEGISATGHAALFYRGDGDFSGLRGVISEDLRCLFWFLMRVVYMEVEEVGRNDVYLLSSVTYMIYVAQRVSCANPLLGEE